MGNSGHKMLEKELKSRENHQKRLKSIGKTMRQLFVYYGANSAVFAFILNFKAVFGKMNKPEGCLCFGMVPVYTGIL